MENILYQLPLTLKQLETLHLLVSGRVRSYKELLFLKNVQSEIIEESLAECEQLLKDIQNVLTPVLLSNAQSEGGNE